MAYLGIQQNVLWLEISESNKKSKYNYHYYIKAEISMLYRLCVNARAYTKILLHFQIQVMQVLDHLR